MSSERPILLLAETGFVIRNLLLGTFAQEVSKTRRLLVAVQKPDDKVLRDIVGNNKKIELIPFPIEPYKDSRRFLHRFFSWDNWIYSIGYARKPVSSRRIQSRLFEGVQDWRIKLLYKLPLVLGLMVNWLGLATWQVNLYLNHYVRAKPITKLWHQILRQHDPVLVVSSMLTLSLKFRCSTDLPVIVAAHDLGIATCTLVQSWDNLSSKTAVLPSWVDVYYTWSETMKKELLELSPGIPEERVKVVGSPQYDFHLDQTLLEDRDKYCSGLGLNPNRPYILIGTGTARWMPDEMPKVVQLVQRIQSEIPGMQTVIRLHPKDHGERWRPYLSSLKQQSVCLQYSSPEIPMDKGGFIPPRDFYREQVNVLFHSSVVINSSSSLTVDAAIFNKPVICIGYDIVEDPVFPEGRSFAYSQSRHFSRLVSTGGVRVVRSEDQCMEWIRRYMEEPTVDSAERQKIVETVTDPQISNAGLRLAHEVVRLASIRL